MISLPLLLGMEMVFATFAAEAGKFSRRVMWPAVVLLALAGSLASARADVLRTQTITVRQGWNAVFLEVSPENPEPAAVFAGTPFDTVGSYFSRPSSAQFVTDPGVDLFKQAGWGVWYAADRPDAFLKSLHAIYGQQPYLIFSRRDFTWTVTGRALPTTVNWQANAFNLVGFSVDAVAGPTFAQFFAGSAAHRSLRLYRLTDGAWRRVINPAAETMRSGEAFWVYCEGNSKFTGPLAVETRLRPGLLLGAGGDSFVLRNQAPHPVSATLEHVAPSQRAPELALVLQLVGDPASPVRAAGVPLPAGHWTQALPALETGAALRVPLEVRPMPDGQAPNDSLIKVTTDLGTVHWVPLAFPSPNGGSN